jgi:hypothetical protein
VGVAEAAECGLVLELIVGCDSAVCDVFEVEMVVPRVRRVLLYREATMRQWVSPIASLFPQAARLGLGWGLCFMLEEKTRV